MKLPQFKEITVEKDQVLLDLNVLPETNAFEGHFPGQPILPGVVQLDWVMQLAQKYFMIAEPVAQKFQVKFTQTLKPGNVFLNIAYSDKRLTFEYRSDENKYSSGSIALEAQAAS